MTRWVEESAGGRDRGPVALGRAWAEVLVRPRRFFSTGVTPGDQAPGLVFAAAVVLIEEATRFALVSGAFPTLGGRPLAAGLLALAASAVLIAPLALHLVAALQTLLLIPFAAERGGVSETVQVLAYAAAPCALAGVPIPALRLACAGYGAALLAVGVAQVHEASLPRAAALAALPAALVFGYGFRGFAAAATLLGSLA